MYNYSFYIMFNFTKTKQEEKKKKVSPGLEKIKSFSHVFSNYYFWIIVTSGEEGIQNLVLFTKENNKCHYVIRLMAFYICVLFSFSKKKKKCLIYLFIKFYICFFPFFFWLRRTYVFRCKGEEKKKRS